MHDAHGLSFLIYQRSRGYVQWRQPPFGGFMASKITWDFRHRRQKLAPTRLKREIFARLKQAEKPGAARQVLHCKEQDAGPNEAGLIRMVFASRRTGSIEVKPLRGPTSSLIQGHPAATGDRHRPHCNLASGTTDHRFRT